MSATWRHSARTPLFRALQRALRIAHAADRPGSPPVDELLEISRQRISRREFLKGSLAVAAAAGAASVPGVLLPPVSAAAPPRIVIVGAGIAGLNAAWHLRKAGYRAAIYEASPRTSGRMYTQHNVMAAGLSTEFGGEFIDSDHEDMLGLVKELNLGLIDTDQASEEDLNVSYFFRNRQITERDVINAYRPFTRRIAADSDKVPDEIGFRDHPPEAEALDRMSLSEYIDRIGMTGWLKELMLVAYVTEYGANADRQSALNFITYIGTDLSKGFEIFGDSDQRYKVRGGNQQVPDALAARMRDQITLERPLVALRGRAGGGVELTFARPGGGHSDVIADYAILALPFTILREVDLRFEMPPYKTRAIRELGYGTNSKLMLGFASRFWRQQSYSGEFYGDQWYQTGWDNSQLQPGTAGGLTLFLGGTPGVDVGRGPAREQGIRALPDLELMFPGATRQWNRSVARMMWPTYRWMKASYASYEPGQWTSIRGAEGLPVGRLYFAGEHTSLDWQGF
ncbi:MAG: flavin monoamine oxidase family protein, partial [bacterium]